MQTKDKPTTVTLKDLSQLSLEHLDKLETLSGMNQQLEEEAGQLDYPTYLSDLQEYNRKH